MLLRCWWRWSIFTCWESYTGISSLRTCWSDQTVTSCFPISIFLFAQMQSQPSNPPIASTIPRFHLHCPTHARTLLRSRAFRTGSSGPVKSKPFNRSGSSWPNRFRPGPALLWGHTSTCLRRSPPAGHTATPSIGGHSGYSSTSSYTVVRRMRPHRTRLRCGTS